MNKVRMTVHFPEDYDAEAVDNVLEDFDEADLWYQDREIRFTGSAERSQELLRAIETVGEHDGVRIIRFSNNQ